MYGLCIFVGIYCSVLVGERLCKKCGLDVQVFWRMVFFALVFGLVGARFYHVLHRLDYFLWDLGEILAVRQGGLGIWGAIFGALFGLFLSTIHAIKPKLTEKAILPTANQENVLGYLDIFAVCAPLAQTLGRWGNFFNHELFGFPTNLPWAIYIPPELRPEAFKYYDHFHPLFLYESILTFGLFSLLYKVYNHQNLKRKRMGIPGGLFVLLYLVGYAVIRLFLEFLRPDPWKILNFPVAGLISILVILIALTVFIWRVIYGKSRVEI